MAKDRDKKRKKHTTKTLRPKAPDEEKRGLIGWIRGLKVWIWDRGVALDWKIALMVLVLMAYGIVMITSVSYYSSIASLGKPFGLLPSVLKFSAAGLLGMWLVSKIDYHIWLKFSAVALVLTVLVLLAVFSSLGHQSHGAQRWLYIGSTTVHPGELAKLGMIVFTAGYISKKGRYSVNNVRVYSVLLATMAVVLVLILLQPNLSTAITIAAIMVGIAFLAGLNWTKIFALMVLAVVGVAGLIVIEPYRFQRMQVLKDPFADRLGDGYQVVQSLLAIGPAGLTGSGLGNSVQKSLWLPEPQNDYILAVIIEETGFIGFLFLLTLYVLLVFFIVKMLLQVKDRFGFLLGSGVLIMVIVQVVLNIAVVTNFAPPTGIILPFVSYGGTALIVLCVAMGMLLSISREVSQDIEAASKVQREAFENVRLKSTR